MTLQGAPQLRARLRAIRTVYKPVGRIWGEDVVALARTRIPVRTGNTRDSVRVKNATMRKTVVRGAYPINFINAGTKAHTIVPRKATTLAFTVNGKAKFAKRVRIPQKAARPFKRDVALRALAEVNILQNLIKVWNDAGTAGVFIR